LKAEEWYETAGLEHGNTKYMDHIVLYVVKKETKIKTSHLSSTWANKTSPSAVLDTIKRRTHLLEYLLIPQFIRRHMLTDIMPSRACN
jgi:hypothetical protein